MRSFASYWAASYGNERVVKVLLERGTEPDKVAFTGDVRNPPLSLSLNPF